ncbi:hypothetical protein Amsp01_079370 [Amycolatopsis sp. NBRC 101858]|uniref:molybdenum cofactor biosysynthesis protein n=1 Tax=Amycolatopsis sp. NBRC 101858 TaxID=3032200 RepID=UPI0024A14CA6|nr:molybdenum cofactor biosysynthesis protein [Amycolatopsis sp. NBRC 101858]GLY41914.1 hypothetical protein Amsp01_079370 [Amycolatopsis sp. NBRC 101858]
MPTPPATISTPVEIVALLVSSAHAFEGRPADGPRPDPKPVERDEVTVRATLGLVGDRYFNQPAHRRAAVTLFAAESLDVLARDLGLAVVPGPHLPRRNIVVRGFPVDELAAWRDRRRLRPRLRGGRSPVPCLSPGPPVRLDGCGAGARRVPRAPRARRRALHPSR